MLWIVGGMAARACPCRGTALKAPCLQLLVRLLLLHITESSSELLECTSPSAK
jgi:hypothetical protein